MVNFSLVGDRLAVKLDEAESVTGGGIVLPDNAKEKSTKGTVVAVGPGKWSEQNHRHIPMSVRVGNRVMIEKYGQTKIEIDGVEYTTLHDEDVLAILPSEEKVAKKK